jgi:hypothetical protein
MTNESVRADLMRIGQTSDFPPEWERVAVPRHPHWCGAVERVSGRWVVRTTTSDEEPWSEDDRFATAAVVPEELAKYLVSDEGSSDV